MTARQRPGVSIGPSGVADAIELHLCCYHRRRRVLHVKSFAIKTGAHGESGGSGRFVPFVKRKARAVENNRDLRCNIRHGDAKHNAAFVLMLRHLTIQRMF